MAGGAGALLLEVYPGRVASSATPAAGTPKRGGTITAAIVNDWIIGEDIFPLFDTLFFLKPDNKGVWRPTPGLVEKWELAGTTAVFNLRRGVKFHDGSDFNAQALKWNFDLWLSDKITGERQAARKDVLNGIDPKNPTTIVDDYTLKINLTKPRPSLLYNLAIIGSDVVPTSKVAYEKMGPDHAARNPVGTGPFQLVEWRPSDRVILKRFDNYWMMGADGKPLPYLDGITIRRIVDDSVRVVELRTQNLNFAELIPSRDLAGLKSDPNLTVTDGPWCGQNYRVIFNARSGPFATDPKLRQAALAAIDREVIAKTLGHGSGAATKYFLLPGTIGYDEKLPYHWFDPGRAKNLMKESKHPNGLEVTFTVVARELDKLTAEMIAQMWGKIGIRTKIDVLERAAWVQRLRGEQGAYYETALMRNPMSATDPDLYMRIILYSKGAFNVAHQDSKEIDDLLDRASNTYDTAERNVLYRRVQNVDYTLANYGYIWMQKWNWVFSRRLKGVPAPMADDWDFRAAWLES